ncbi:MAG TPA: spermidine synthase [Burkholderiaceae bacterium]|nr:spermidine synthase [Burkholderiaceae bacterium]
MPSDVPTLSEQGGIRYLHFGTEWIQGAMDVRRPSELVLSYTRQMMAWLLFLQPDRDSRMGILGLGAGSLLRFVLKHTPGSAVTVEWNPDVVAICRAYFRLPESIRSTVAQCDAADWLKRPGNLGRHLALMVDLYDSQAQGPVRESLEFYSDCRRALADTGVLTVNLFGDHPSYARNLANIREAFNDRVLVLPEVDEGNVVVLALKGPLLEVSVRRFIERAAQVEAETGLPARRWARALLARRAGAPTFQA